MRRILILLIAVLAITGCKKSNTLIIKGTLQKPRQEYIYLSRIDVNVPVIVDSSKISGSGGFSFRIRPEEPDFYQLSLSPVNFANLLAQPGEKIRLEFVDSSLYSNYTVTGSSGSELIRTLDLRLMDTKRKLDSLNSVYNKASAEPDFEDRAPLLEEEYARLIREQRMFNIEFILKNLNSLAAIKALYQEFNEDTYVLYESRDLQYFKIVTDTLKKYFPGSKHTKALVSNFEKEMSQFNARRLQLSVDNLPEIRLDPNLMDINGNRVLLSSLRGKYVLLAFWSAQSRDCIADNLQLKEFYRLYNKRGFEIYQINLDADENVWRTAVNFDELPWISTREDDPARPENARLYNVQRVPMNYLYDPNGNIIGTDLHGRNLQIKLNQIFRN